MKLILLKPTGEIQIGEMKRSDNLLLHDFGRLLNCEVCELVRVKYEKFKKYQFWCDEEGLLKKRPMLNPIASFYYGIGEHNQPIVGNVLIAKTVMTSEGEDTEGLTDEDCKLILDDIISNKDKILEACHLEAEGN